MLHNLSATITLLLLIICLAGCGETPNGVDTTVDPGVSRSAARLHAINEAQNDVVPAGEFQTRTSGTVIELPTNAIKIKTDAFPDGSTIAISPNVDVWLTGEKVDRSEINIGDQVDLFSEQKGNRADGYQSLVTRINISQSIGDKETEADAAKDYSIQLRGVVVEANTNAVTIRDANHPDLEPTIMPVVRLVKVTRNGEVGGTSLLQPGDAVTLRSQSRGNRQDGYIDVVTHITVDADGSN